jgi:glutathionyl-hydroquinone reductase
MADGSIERVDMALGGWRHLSVISGSMHNLADWHKDGVTEITIRRKGNFVRVSKAGKAYDVVENDEQHLTVVLSCVWLHRISCLILTNLSHRRPAIPMFITRDINRVENIINADAHAGVVIEADAQPSFMNHCYSKASNLDKLMTKTRNPR